MAGLIRILWALYFILAPHWGEITWYGKGGKYTASGRIFRPNGYYAASNIFPFGSLVSVSYRGNTVLVEITDRGQFRHELDITRGAAEALGMVKAGRVKALIEVVRIGDDHYKKESDH